jgi:hypothetical protein
VDYLDKPTRLRTDMIVATWVAQIWMSPPDQIWMSVDIDLDEIAAIQPPRGFGRD